MGVGFHFFIYEIKSTYLFWQRRLNTGYPSLASCLSVEILHPNFSKFKALGNALNPLTSTTQSL